MRRPKLPSLENVPVFSMATRGRAYRRIYGHLSDDELHSFYRSGFVPTSIYEYVCAERGLKPRP